MIESRPGAIRIAVLCGVLVVGLALAQRVLAQSAGGEADALQDEAVERLQDYIRINTINPPGNESRAVDFLARILEQEGIEYETAESAPGRGNIWARLDGGSEPALLLLHHSDVVPADEAYWSVPVLSGEIKDGHIYGRGALDTKTLGIYHLQTFLALHRSGLPLDRDVIFMATADEEAGGFYGAGWLVENRPDVFEGVGFVLNEGGGGTIDGDRVEFGIEVTQKVPVWLRLVATGIPGHGSTPRTESSVTKLVRALDRLRQHRFEPRILPPVDAYFKGIAPNAGEEWREAYADMASAVLDPEFLSRLQLHSPFQAAITRNACSITRLEGSEKINVVPPTATAEIDCRLLPDQDIDEFLAELGMVINDPGIEIETIMAFTPAISSTDNEVFRAMEAVTRENFPGAAILPSVQSGFTDSHFFRDLGIEAYGYSPDLIPLEDDQGVHGNDERISVENVRRGVLLMLDTVERIVTRR
jgi:acetylornithine deacetylase/succinyl-diaminopimelate desuccinylase-like protein